MKVLIIGGNRFVGLRLARLLDARKDVELEVVNRTGQVAHVKNTVIHKGDRHHLDQTILEKTWDVVYDFAGFTARDLRATLKFFEHVNRYIYISTASVYDQGANRVESSFNPANWPIVAPLAPPTQEPYAFGKREAEAVLAQEAKWPTLMVRFPVILGPDDYTQRLEFHINRVRENRPIVIPNPSARISMVHSQDAAEFLQRALSESWTGSLNVASPDSIALNELMVHIERAAGKKALVLTSGQSESKSPYAPESDHTLSVALAKQKDFTARAIKDWLPSLIGEFNPNEQKTRLH